MKPLLLLRPKPGLSRSAERARALGIETIACPLFAIEPLAWTPPAAQDFDALLLTSANAVLHAGAGIDDYRALPVHAVGAATAHAAEQAGLTVATVGRAGVEALLAALPPGQRLLQLAGAHRVAADPAEASLTIVPVYRAAAIADAVLPRLDGLVVAVHSPRAGRRLAALAGRRAGAAVAAISEAAAAACGAGWAGVAVAEVPDDEALLALAARLCQATPQP